MIPCIILYYWLRDTTPKSKRVAKLNNINYFDGISLVTSGVIYVISTHSETYNMRFQRISI